MNQVSYGTITITDTNDIEQIYMVYAGSESNVTPPDVSDFTLWKTDVTQTSGTYIWQRTVVKKSGIEITAVNFQQFYGEPVCVTGDGGRSIKSITTYYCNYGTGTPEENYSGWSIDTPEYDEDKPNYWVKTVIIYVDDSEEEFELNGDIVTFEDGEHKHLTSLTATINPKQSGSGDPSPDNVRPISGWGSVNVTRSGKNLLPYPYASSNANKTVNGVTFTVTNDGILTVTGTPTKGTSFTFSKNLIDAIGLKAGDEIYVSTGTAYDTKAYFRLLYTNPTPMEGITRIDVDVKKIVITNDMVTRGLWFELWIPSGNGSISITVKPMVSFSSDGIYEPYTGTTYHTDLPETVYGGSFDVVNGVLTVDRAMVDLGTLNWGYNSSYEFFYSKINSLKKNGNLLCSAYNFVGPKSNEAMANVVNGSIATSVTQYAKIKNTAYTNTTSFKTAMNGVQLVYELATPQTYQLTPQQVTTLLGTNYIWADSGDVSVSGFTIVNKDVQIHIDNSLTEALSKAANALEKANEAESIAAHANEGSQGALSIATGINQHFFSIPSKYSESVPAGSYITEINVDEFKRSPSGGNLLTRSDGVWLRNGADILASLQGTGLTFLIPTGTYKGRKSLEILGGTTPTLKLYDAQNNNAVATLNSNGLVLSKGGIRVNTVGSNNGVYISSENLGSKVTSLDADKINWRAVIGSKFGVDSEGNLYANEAHVSGAITATSLQVDGLGDFMSFMTFENDVLKITKPGFNYTVEIRNDGVYIVDPNNNTIASYKNYITLGTKDGNNIDIRSDSINFDIGDKTFAYVAQDKWLTSNAEVSGAMYIGNYSLRQNSNGNFILGRRY